MKRFPAHLVHPFLFGWFPIFSLLSHNARVTSGKEIFLPFALVTGFTLAFLVASRLVRISMARASLILTIGYLLFFSYGQMLNLLFGTTFDVIPTTASLVLLIVWIAIFVAAVFYITRSCSSFKELHLILVVAGTVAVLYPAAVVTVQMVHTHPYAHRWDTVVPLNVKVEGKAAYRPDIYYLILDGYGREDTLKRIYGLDNQPFLRNLEKIGFTVLREARTNYCITTYSLSSSLNMAYLQDLLTDSSVNDMNLIQQNRVMRIMHDLGYRIVTFSSGYTETEIHHSDRYIRPGLALTEFQNLLINYTPIPFLSNLLGTKTQYDLHRDRILFTLDHLSEVADDPAPTFTFVHLLIPHPPFVFDASGGPVSSKVEFALGDGPHYFFNHTVRQYLKGYTGQVAYLNRRLVPLVQTIIRRSADPPVIILQGDHGPGSALDWSSAEKSDLYERMTILNAWFAPERVRSALYTEMTPVNSFRTLFRELFGLNLPKLPDRVYFSRWGPRYDFTDVTDRVSGLHAIPDKTPGTQD